MRDDGCAMLLCCILVICADPGLVNLFAHTLVYPFWMYYAAARDNITPEDVVALVIDAVWELEAAWDVRPDPNKEPWAFKAWAKRFGDGAWMFVGLVREVRSPIGVPAFAMRILAGLSENETTVNLGLISDASEFPLYRGRLYVDVKLQRPRNLHGWWEAFGIVLIFEA